MGLDVWGMLEKWKQNICHHDPSYAVLIPTWPFKFIDKSFPFTLTAILPPEVNAFRHIQTPAGLPFAQSAQAPQTGPFRFGWACLPGRVENHFLLDVLVLFLVGRWRRDSRWWCFEVVSRRRCSWLQLSKLVHLRLHLSVCLPYQLEWRKI